MSRILLFVKMASISVNPAASATPTLVPYDWSVLNFAQISTLHFFLWRGDLHRAA